MLPSDTVIVWLVAVPAVASASAAGAIVEPRIDRQRIGLREGRAGGVGDSTVKLAVPAAVGVPESTTVPAVASVVRFAAVSPVVAGAEPGRW